MTEPAASPLASLAFVNDGLQLVERAVREQLASEGEVVRPIGDHVLSGGGKRIRPAILLLAAELCGYRGPRRVQVGAAIELLHTATLLHDDVVDLSRLRRGNASANAVWGNRRAVLVGDFFFARASAMIVEDGDPDILWLFANTIRRMSEGELLQLRYSFDPTLTERQYYAVIERKSAELLAAACEAGAILGAVTRAERRRLAQFGREVGIAFQLRDDALDYSAGAGALGKSRYADLREGKVTLPLLVALDRCSPADREQALAVLKTAAHRSAELERNAALADECPLSDDELAPVVELVARQRGVQDTDRRAEEHLARAEAAIAPFPDGPAKRALLEAADFAVARDR